MPGIRCRGASIVDIINNLKIRTKLTVFIVAFGLVLIATGVAGLAGITVSRNALASVHNQTLLGINLLNEIRNRQMQMRIQKLFQCRHEIPTSPFVLLGTITPYFDELVINFVILV